MHSNRAVLLMHGTSHRIEALYLVVHLLVWAPKLWHYFGVTHLGRDPICDVCGGGRAVRGN